MFAVDKFVAVGKLAGPHFVAFEPDIAASNNDSIVVGSKDGIAMKKKLKIKHKPHFSQLKNFNFIKINAT